MKSVDTIVIDPAARRPIKARQSRWAAAATGLLVRRGVSPNAISAASVAVSAVAGGCLVAAYYARPAWAAALLYLLAAGGIQLRLVCNLLDGMVAVEGKRASKVGELFNDFPDRLADPILFAAAGYGAAGVPLAIDLGWAAAAMSLLTAYTRVLGRSAGSGVYFAGPMAKQHRMAVMTAACVAAAIAVPWGWQGRVIWVALAVVVAGCVVTVVRRLRLIAADLERR